MCLCYQEPSDDFSPISPVTIISFLPSYILLSLPFSCPLVARQHSSGAREAVWQCLDKKALVFLPPVEASWLEVGQLAEGQRQPPVAMAFSPLGANLTLRGNT